MHIRTVVLLFLGVVVSCQTSFAQQEVSISGSEVFEQRCAYCHGKSGRGDGVPAGVLGVKPRDLTAGVYKIRSTESGSIPRDADLIRTISMGLRGSSMPAWKGILSDEEIYAVAAYIKTLSPRFAVERPTAVSVPRRTSYPESGVRKGKKFYEQLECGSCHGSDGTGGDAIATDFEDDWGNPIVAANLTEPWTFRGGSSDKDIYLRILTGMDGTPMPSYKGVISDFDLYDVAQYVSSLARKPAWEMTAEELQKHYATLEEKATTDPVAWGKYLVSFMGCNDCHSAVNTDGSLVTGKELAGGQRWTLEPYFSDLYTPNLTPDEETGIGRYTDDQLRDALTKGIRPSDGSRMLPFPMPWPNLAGMRSADIDAIIAYLRSLPAVYNAVPERNEPNIVSYLWMKFEMLVLKKPFPAIIHGGNAGMSKESSMSNAMTSGEGVQP